MKTLAIVVPCYNEEETIHPFLEACQAVERQMANSGSMTISKASKIRSLIFSISASVYFTSDIAFPPKSGPNNQAPSIYYLSLQ